MFLGYEQIGATTAAANSSAFTMPVGTQYCLLQADPSGPGVRYTMNGDNTPTNTLGMVLVAGLAPERFTAEDVANINFISVNTNTKINVHYLQ
jgi:hypothetical protein